MTQPSRFSDKSIEKLYISRFPGVTYQEMGGLHKKFNQIIRDYSYKGVKIIDLENAIPSNDQNIFDVIHFSEIIYTLEKHLKLILFIPTVFCLETARLRYG